jgi:hypothetical protein
MVCMTRGVVSNWEQGMFLPPADKRDKLLTSLASTAKRSSERPRIVGHHGAPRAAAQPSARVTNRQIEPHKHRAAGCIARNRFAIFPATALDLPHSAASPWCAMALQHWWGAMIDSGLA